MDKTKTPLRCVNIATQLGASSQPKRRDSEQQQERTSSFFAKLEKYWGFNGGDSPSKGGVAEAKN